MSGKRASSCLVLPLLSTIPVGLAALPGLPSHPATASDHVTRVEGISRTSAGLTVEASSPSGSQTFEADLVVHGAGRVAEIDDLDLAAAEIERGKRGILVNQYLQSTSNAAVYAAGDAAETVGNLSRPWPRSRDGLWR